jgi:hypothetical protein
MKCTSRNLLFIIITLFCLQQKPLQGQARTIRVPAWETGIRNYVDSLRIVDTHEHLFDPEILRESILLDFSLLLLENSFDDLVDAGMPKSTFGKLFNNENPPKEKWKEIEPYWNKSFNTSYNRVLLSSIKNLYGIDGLNASTVDTISSSMKIAYKGNWFNHVLRDMCKIDWVIQDDEYLGDKRTFVRYSGKFTGYLGIKSKFAIDSIAVSQVDPIYTLDDLVNSMGKQFEEKVAEGMVAVKVDIAYKRTLHFENTTEDAAKKVFHKIVTGNEDFSMTTDEAKPLQDYLMYRLLDLARLHKLPVAFHTGFLAGQNNIIGNADPSLLTNLFLEYPDIRFVLFHGSYPFGGTSSSLAKNYPNVYIDMNWIFAISPAYSARYLNEWLDMVPASKLFAFGGDQRTVENTYGQILTAKHVISDVLVEKVRAGYLSESEARKIAKMILHDNAVEFYNLF